MRILVDMNLSPRWVEQLRRSGWEAEHWSTVGSSSAADATIMRHARSNGYVVLTHDLDFGAILAATGDDSPSVIQIRARDVSPDAVGPQVLTALGQLSSEIEAGALVSVFADRHRVRLLPIP